MTELLPTPAQKSHARGVLAWARRHRSRLLLWARVGIAVGLMAFVVSLVLHDQHELKDVNWELVPLVWGLMLLSTAFKSLRWSLLVRQSGMNLSYRYLLGTYFVGAFFSTVLPTAVGGDAVRAVQTAAHTGRKADAMSSVLIERGFGLLAVIGAGSIFALFLKPGTVPLPFVLAVHGLFLAGIVGIVVLRQGWFIEPIARLMVHLRLGRLVDRVRHLQSALSGHLGRPIVLGEMLFVSILANMMSMGATYLTLAAVTDPIPLVSFVPVMALATTAELIPISISALGVKEGAYVFFLGLVGVDNAQAGVVAIITRVLMWGLALVGGIIFLARTMRARSRAAAAGLPSQD
jgi:uncharacterized protein (TIRG00374 family)